MQNHRPRIYLASRSPRRGELLTQIGVSFDVMAADTDESVYPGELPQDYVGRVASAKARVVRERLPPEDARPILAADTAVIVEERILGKPRDREDGLEMLRSLSGRSHRVLTAVALVAGERQWMALSVSRVTFRHLAEEEMRRYWRSGEPIGKAGGYAIQGLGALFIAGLDGSYSGVMGLPLFETGQLLEHAGIELLLTPL